MPVNISATPHTLVQLRAPRDTNRLQRFLERCSDFYELHEGCPTPADAGEYELTAVPDTADPGDLRVLALEERNGTLHAVSQFLRNYPEPGIAWIGMLVVAPEQRGRGIGLTLLRHTLGHAAAEGAREARLVVSVHNPRAQRFWEAAGFRDTQDVRSVTTRSGHVGTVRIYCRDLRSASAP